MNLNDKRFWICWTVLMLLMVVVAWIEGWSEDIALLSVAYALSLLSIWLYHKVKPRFAFGNLVVMICYNGILEYNLLFNSQYGTGLTWWFFALLLNTIHSTVLFAFTINGIIKLRSNKLTDRRF